MSEKEQFEEQGRAYAALRESKAKVATLTSALMRYSQRLEDANSILKRFLSDPLHEDRDPGAPVKTSENLKSFLRGVYSSTIVDTVDELLSEMRRERQLQEQVEKF